MTCLSKLYHHLVRDEIFTRLPVKDLIVLTSVCKSWLELISSASFVQTHLSRFHLNPDNHSLLSHLPLYSKIIISPINFFGNPHICIIPTPGSEVFVEASGFRISRNLLLSSDQDHLSDLQTFVGSLNGLVCFSRPRVRPTNLVIWNPATHKYKDILVPQFNIKDMLMVRIVVAFGFNGVDNDYKIVCIYEFVLMENVSYQFLMYSCHNNSWKELKSDFPSQLIFEDECVIVKGSPYWMCYKQSNKYICVKLNVETEGIQMFDAPEYVNNEIISTSFMALGDYAGQAVFSPGAEAIDIIHLYTLEETSGVWMRKYSFELFGVQRPVSVKSYLNDKIILTLGYERKLHMYNLTSKQIKDLAVAEGRGLMRIFNYIESLVAIEGMVSVRDDEAVKEERRQETATLTTTNRTASDATM